MARSINLLTPSPSSLISPQQPILEPEQERRKLGDVAATRSSVYNRVLDTVRNLEPVANANYTLSLSDVDYQDSDKVSLKDQKAALLGGQTRGRRMRGTWQLIDNATGEVKDSKRTVLMTVPHLTERGTYIHKGNEYALKNQQRLRPGVFTRLRDNGEVEAHANILPGKGLSHRYYLNPETGVFYMRAGQAKIPLMPLLNALGANSEQLRETWGNKIYAANFSKDEASSREKLKQKFLNKKDLEAHDNNAREALVAKFKKMELDPEVMLRTLGKPYKGLELDAVLDITKKLIGVSKGEQEVDNRDDMTFQKFMGPEDLFAERIAKDYGGTRRELLYKLTRKGNLSSLPSSALKKQIESTLLTSGLGQPLEEINPAEIYDKVYSVTRMGEGGIPSSDAIPEEARDVQPSQLGFVDFLRTPESGRTGVDLFVARNAMKGKDGKLYAQFFDPKSNRKVWRNPDAVARMTIAFPDAMDSENSRVPAMRGGKVIWADKKNVDLVLPAMEDALSPLANIIPMKSMVKGQRLVMASRMSTQALPIVGAEAPLVQSAVPGTQGTRSYEDEYSDKLGSLYAKQGGKVTRVGKDGISVRYADGTEDKLELYNNFPFNRKTFLHQTPTVEPGMLFKPGQLLAKSNFTDKSGASALGTNARTAYLAWEGKNFEDAIVISEGYAKRMSSEHMYQYDLEEDKKTTTGKKKYISLFPGKYTKENLARYNDNGVIKPGTVVNDGDPLILAVKQREGTHHKVHKKGQSGYADASVIWDHHDPGIVTDVVLGKKGPIVVTKTVSSMHIGDKLSGRYGDKGVIADVIPDNKMPHDADGKPYEVLLNPLGIISRTNPAQMAELYLGKIAAKNGKPIKVQDFDTKKDMSAWVQEQLSREGLSDLDDIYDPTRDKKIKQIATGSRFFMKLHHTAEGKGQARGSGAYSMDDAPAKGGKSGSKRVALLDTNALLSHGATENLRDVGAVRGQRSEDYWLQFMSGYNPKDPKVPLVYKKFVNQLQAAGVNVKRSGTQTNIMALTDADVDKLAGKRELKNSSGVEWGKGLKPVPGGLFDPQITGGHSGNQWSAIKLAQPTPNPVMEEPIRRLLGLTRAGFEDVLAHKKDLPGYGTGTAAIANALKAINVDKGIASARAEIASGKKSGRDNAIKKLAYLKSAKKLNLSPESWLLKRAPVLPPTFRPVTVMGSNEMPLISDSNFLYKELFEANQNLEEMRKLVGEKGAGEEELSVYKAFKAVTGLGDPISQKLQDKQVRGILKEVFGTSPKFGTVQRKLIASTVDNVGRAVISPNPNLDMDSVGLPEDKAFEVYQKFVIRRLKRKGMSISQAMKEIKEKTPRARELLLEEMDERPVIINRAPVLHKFGILAMKPQLTKGQTMQVSPLIVKGFNADFDGDAMNYHVPATEEAKREALERLLPSKNLLSPADFKSPMHTPANEYVGGLWYATSKRSKRPKKIFRTMKDLRAAYENGDVSLSDAVQVLEK